MAQLIARQPSRPDPVSPRDPGSGCPTCGHEDLVSFLELTDMPVFNNVLYSDQSEAQAATTGTIHLVICQRCGMVYNAAFDPERVTYSPAYENSLHGSSVFGEWATALARRLGHDHRLAGGRVLEVGAGSGEFLSLLCQVAGCTGVGFDPSHDPADDRPVGDILVGTGSSHDGEDVDLVVCRHVLEHVADPVAFLQGIAESLAAPQRRARVPIYLEVPDASYMLSRDAFWDVIYEHPLYFDQSSLRTVFGAAGYDIVRTGQTFADQFAWIEGFVATTPAQPPRGDIAHQLVAAAGFGERFTAAIEHYQATLAAVGDSGRIAIWGAGSKGVTFCNLVPAAAGALVVDVNPRKAGKRLPITGQAVMPPDGLIGSDIELVVIMNGQYQSEIRQTLNDLGVTVDVIVV